MTRTAPDSFRAYIRVACAFTAVRLPAKVYRFRVVGPRLIPPVAIAIFRRIEQPIDSERDDQLRRIKARGGEREREREPDKTAVGVKARRSSGRASFRNGTSKAR